MSIDLRWRLTKGGWSYPLNYIPSTNRKHTIDFLLVVRHNISTGAFSILPSTPLSFRMSPRSYTYFFLIPFPSLLLPSSLSHPSNSGRAEFSDFGLLVHRLWAKVHQVNVTHCTLIMPTHWWSKSFRISNPSDRWLFGLTEPSPNGSRPEWRTPGMADPNQKMLACCYLKPRLYKLVQWLTYHILFLHLHFKSCV